MPNLSSLIGGGGGAPVEIGPSHATGTGNATLVTSEANTAGVVLRTVCLSGRGDGLVRLFAGANIILRTGDGGTTGGQAVSLTNVLVPAGLSVSLTASGSGARYDITYEVL